MNRSRIEGIGAGRNARVLIGIGVVGLGVLALNPVPGRAATQPTFAADYVDNALAGGEPFVIYSHAGSDLVYAAHEGTTHLDKNGVPTADSACDVLPPPKVPPTGFACSYTNHINQWFSTDGGVTWTLVSATNNPLAGTTAASTGFSDPSLTEDAPPATSGPQNVYDTGIDLANDALYASNDGGKTWNGTPDCVQGDRPWLAGGQNGEVFLATDIEGAEPGSSGSLTQGHAYFHGLVQESTATNPPTIATITCDTNGLQDPAGGDAQDYFDRNGDACTAYSVVPVGSWCAGSDRGDIIEGASGFTDGGFGIGVLPDASSAWPAPTTTTPDPAPTGTFIDREGANCTTNAEIGNPTPGAAGTDATLCSELGPITPEIAIDQGNTTYVVWATNPRSSSNGNGCSGASAAGGAAILPNAIYMIYTKDEGKTWSTPLTIADPSTSGGNTLLWPFVTAGAAGNVAVVWYQSTALTDPDCDSEGILTGTPTPWTLQEATILNATGSTGAYPPASVNTFPAEVPYNSVNPVQLVAHPGGVFHAGGVCESGTTCVATGQDRRLGDYFTDALDQNGCVVIATGDTNIVDQTTGGQLDLSRPVFLQQASGPSLTTGQPCVSALAQSPVSTPEAPVLPALLAVGGVSGVAVAIGRRRRRASRAAM